VFTDPPLATVGLSEEAAVQQLPGAVEVFVATSKPLRDALLDCSQRLSLYKVIVHADTDKAGAFWVNFTVCFVAAAYYARLLAASRCKVLN
jgi:pyruvate/2-oxoglutarate dehydrogenase complex dihydrolipoamide dehydrogenase (E3) component